jgi:acyl carrier protein
MEPDLALEALGQVLERGETCLTVANIDWDLYAPAYSVERARPLIGEIPEARGALTTDIGGSDGQGQAFRASLAGLSERERERMVQELVCAHVATVLGHSGTEALDVVQPFRELGFDSLMAVELRNRLQSAADVQLPTTVVFDYPSSVLLAEHLSDALAGGDGGEDASVEAGLANLEVALATLGDEGQRSRVTSRLQALVAGLSATGGPGGAEGPEGAETVAEKLEGATDEEIFGFIEGELGSL